MPQRYTPFALPQIMPVQYVNVGQTFNVPLSSNPSTGYQWTITNQPQFISLADEKYVPDPHPPGMVGVGGTQVFTFVANYTGDGILSFVYSTPWGESGSNYAVRIIATST